jgi:hypothetical protein
LKIAPFQNCVQFITLLSTPEAEVDFLERKKKYRSAFGGMEVQVSDGIPLKEWV